MPPANSLRSFKSGPFDSDDCALAAARAGSLAGPQTICLSLIVKNENGPHLARCLNSVRAFVTAWAIVDTGSTDGTQQMIRERMSDIPGQLVEREWVYDFAHSRNQALDLARASGADFAMTLDADDHVAANGFGLPALGRLTRDVVIFTGVEGDTLSPRPTFLRLGAPLLHWRGRLHESPFRVDGTPITRAVIDAYITRVTRDGRASRDMAAKAETYHELCLRGVEREPGDAHAWECLVHDFIVRKNQAEAKRCARQALRCIPHTPRDPAVERALAGLAYERGEPKP